MVCTSGIGHERLDFLVAVLDPPAIGVLAREPGNLVDESDRVGFTLRNGQIGIFRLENHVMDAVVVDGVRLPVGRFLLRVDEFLVECPVNRSFGIFSEDVVVADEINRATPKPRAYFSRRCKNAGLPSRGHARAADAVHGDRHTEPHRTGRHV